MSLIKWNLTVAICASIVFCAAFSAHGEAAGTVDSARVIFEQPVLEGVAGNFHVPLAEHGYPKEKTFNLILWQPNPGTANGKLVPTSWRAGDRTGFYPAGAPEEHQAGFRDAVGASTVQIEGDTVGAYLNSQDLPQGSNGDKMMITPECRFSNKQGTYPFAHPGTAIAVSLELQVPTARDQYRKGCLTYVVSDLQFEDRRTHTQISYSMGLFHHAETPEPQASPDWLRGTEVGAFDVPSHSFQVGNHLVPGSRVVTVLAGSTLFQNQPWKGWRTFRGAVTEANFRTALQALKAKHPEFGGSENPADYELTRWHLNAELKFSTGPAELGWSMRLARIELVPDVELKRSE